ncbi:hypothetical protein RDWZM_009164 [Blomia tropicalis]|uniref:Uncharacterized protein n=1 Tax=Blomia tropicalis TaxID=40697 RepID=A0A9Q0M4W7_BLOTA|nr:hypothetical protein BLOT_016312 [Blomia tropicalis]KAJ6218007.1 hypothetical protein RDWZM_009164 [Blomia tropicalis]
MDQVIEYLSETPPTTTQGSMRNNRIIFAICNSLGSIVLLNENRRVVRKANVTNHADIRLGNPLEYLNKFATDPSIKFTIGTNAAIFLMYCHRAVEKLRTHCSSIVLLGPVSIVFSDHRIETEDAQIDHSRRCCCGHLCHSNPPSFTLDNGDQLIFNTGVFYLRACSEQHSIYITKSEFISQVKFIPSILPPPDSIHPLIAFVDTLPDSPPPIIT